MTLVRAPEASSGTPVSPTLPRRETQEDQRVILNRIQENILKGPPSHDAETIKRYEYQMLKGYKLFDAHKGKMYMIDLLDTPLDQVNQHHPFDPKRVLEIPRVA